MPFCYKINPVLSAEEIADLRKKVGWEPREDRLEKLVDCTYLAAACFDGDKLIGYVDVLSDGLEDALIRSLVVHPAYQRRGIALKMLELVVSKIRAARIKTINVLFEPELKSLYEKAGFRIVCGGLIDNDKQEGF